MAFTFASPITPSNIWTLCFRTKEEMIRIYGETPDDKNVRYNGITEFTTQTVYIDKELDGFLLRKTLRHELTHIYLWETGQQDRMYSEEELCEIMSVSAPLITRAVDDIVLRLKEGLYKHG